MATKYVSSLTGEEMDAALIDMAYHNSEAYAVGTRNGVAVGSSDVTYHNNAKYYAEQTGADVQAAEAAAARAEAAVPAGTAGAVFFDRAQSLTTAQQAQARANIMAGGSNPNLLDNPWFTVNQRSFTTGTNGSYFADRWKLSNTDLITATRNNDGTITFTKTSGASALIQHYIDRQTGLDEEATYTASLMDGDGNVYSVTEKFVPGTQSEKPVFINGLRVAIGLYGKGGQIWMGLYLQSAGSGTFTIKAAKLELGSVSTLANDAPPDYGTELIKCRGYFERIHSLGSSEIVGMGMGASASSVRIGIPSLICHTIQSVTYSGGGLLLEGGGNYRTLTSIGKLNATPKNGFLTVTCGSSDAITPYQTYALVGTAAGGYIDISADL